MELFSINLTLFTRCIVSESVSSEISRTSEMCQKIVYRPKIVSPNIDLELQSAFLDVYVTSLMSCLQGLAVNSSEQLTIFGSLGSAVDV